MEEQAQMMFSKVAAHEKAPSVRKRMPLKFISCSRPRISADSGAFKGEKGELEYGVGGGKISEKTDVVSGERRRQRVEEAWRRRNRAVDGSPSY